METRTDLIILGSNITANGDFSHVIKNWLLLGRKAMTNLDSILKSRDITLPTNVCLVKAMIFSSSPVWMWDLDHKESRTVKNCCFRTVVLVKTLENPLNCKKSQVVHPKGIQSWIFFGRMMVKVKLQYFNHLMGRSDSLENTLMLGTFKSRSRGDNRGLDSWMASLTQWTWVWAVSGYWWWTGKPGVLHSMGLQRVRHDWTTELKYVFNFSLAFFNASFNKAILGIEAFWNVQHQN